MAGTKRRNAKKPKANKRRARAREIAVINKLRQVSDERRPFRQLSKQVIDEVLARYGDGDGVIVEVGSGDGQLRSLMPERVLRRMVHTEPIPLGAKRLKDKYPTADIRCASAEQLPLGDGEADALVALCVFDLLKDGPAVAREAARVLKPGGHVIHFLDMSAEPRATLYDLHASNQMVIPNIFSDPCEKPWPLDMYVVPISHLQLLVRILERTHQKYAQALRQYVDLFAATPFSEVRAGDAYTLLWEDANAKVSLQRVMQTAASLATPDELQELNRTMGTPASAPAFLDARLKKWFSPEQGFRPATSEMVAKRQVVSDIGRPERYLSMSAGHIRELQEPPHHLLCAGRPDRLSDNETLVEQSIYVFAAERVV